MCFEISGRTAIASNGFWMSITMRCFPVFCCFPLFNGFVLCCSPQQQEEYGSEVSDSPSHSWFVFTKLYFPFWYLGVPEARSSHPTHALKVPIATAADAEHFRGPMDKGKSCVTKRKVGAHVRQYILLRMCFTLVLLWGPIAWFWSNSTTIFSYHTHVWSAEWFVCVSWTRCLLEKSKMGSSAQEAHQVGSNT